MSNHRNSEVDWSDWTHHYGRHVTGRIYDNGQVDCDPNDEYVRHESSWGVRVSRCEEPQFDGKAVNVKIRHFLETEIKIDSISVFPHLPDGAPARERGNPSFRHEARNIELNATSSGRWIDVFDVKHLSLPAARDHFHFGYHVIFRTPRRTRYDVQCDCSLTALRLVSPPPIAPPPSSLLLDPLISLSGSLEAEFLDRRSTDVVFLVGDEVGILVSVRP